MSLDVGLPSIKIRNHNHSRDTDFIELKQRNSIPTVRKKKLCLKERGVSQGNSDKRTQAGFKIWKVLNNKLW